MSDYISREAASADECKHKMKTSFAKIIVGRNYALEANARATEGG